MAAAGKPGKPWYRVRNAVLALLLLVLCGVGYLVYTALTARPGRPVDYASQMEALVRSAQPAGVGPEAGDAFRVLQEAIAAQLEAEAEVYATTTDRTALDYTILFGPVSFESPGYDRESQARMRERGRRALAAMEARGVPELLDRVAAIPRANGFVRQEGPLIMWLLPHLARSRNLARACAAGMTEAGARGEAGEVARRYEHLLAMGRVHTQQGFLMERLVGVAIMALAQRQLSEELIEQRFDEPTLRACLEALERQRGWCGSARVALESERLSLLDTVQMVYTDNGKGDGRLVVTAYQSMAATWGWRGTFAGGGGVLGFLDKLSGYKIMNLTSFAFAGKRAVTQKINRLIDLAIEAQEAPPPERARIRDALDKELVELPRRHIVLKMIMPALGRFTGSNVQHEQAIEAMRLHLALEIYRARHGGYPGALAALVPEILAEIPDDPHNGLEFGYRLLGPGEDARGRGFLLYSFGADMQDNGGRTHGSSPYLALQPVGAGLDLVFNIPRQTQEELDREAQDGSDYSP